MEIILVSFRLLKNERFATGRGTEEQDDLLLINKRPYTFPEKPHTQSNRLKYRLSPE